MNRLLIFTIGSLALLLAACGGDDDAPAAADGQPTESAGDALKRQLEYVLRGQTGRAYDALHPAQQAIIPRDLYMSCTRELTAVELVGWKVLETYPEEVTIPGTTVKTASTAVTVRMTLKQGSQQEEATNTYHEYAVDGEWRFSSSGADAFKEGRCP